MAKQKKVKKPVTVTTVIEEEQHEALRYLAYKEYLPMAELIRKALDQFIREEARKFPIPMSSTLSQAASKTLHPTQEVFEAEETKSQNVSLKKREKK